MQHLESADNDHYQYVSEHYGELHDAAAAPQKTEEVDEGGGC